MLDAFGLSTSRIRTPRRWPVSTQWNDQARTSLEVAKQWAENADEMEMTALNKRPQAQLPLQEKPNKAMESMGGLINKAGNLFRKGG